MAAIPSADFAGVFERSNRAAQDLRAQVEKIIRSDIDESRTARSVLLQSIGSVLEDIASMKKTVEKIPASIGASLKAKAETGTDNQEIMGKLDGISSQLEEIIHGLKSFGEAYANDKEQQTPFVSQNIYSGSDAQMEKLLTDSLPGLEGLLRANAKAQSKELEGFSRELSELVRQNSTALIHEVKAGVRGELSRMSDDMLSKAEAKREGEFAGLRRMFRVIMIMSGASIALTVIVIIMMLLK